MSCNPLHLILDTSILNILGPIKVGTFNIRALDDEALSISVKGLITLRIGVLYLTESTFQGRLVESCRTFLVI